MIGAISRPSRNDWLSGLAIGGYAALIAIAPGFPMKAALAAPLLLAPFLLWILRSPTAWLGSFFACALLLPPLPIRLGDSGPHIAILFAAAGLWIGLLRLNQWRFEQDAPAAALLFLVAIFLASVAAAAIHSGVVIAAGSLARVGLFGISVFVFLYTRFGPGRYTDAQAWRAIHLLFWAATLSALFACVDFYFQFPAPAGYEQQFVWLDSGVFRRAQGVFYEASTLGNLCAFFLEMILVALFRRRAARLPSALTLILGGGALVAALVLSYSRASLVNLAVAIVMLLWLYRDRIRWPRFLTVVGACSGAGAFALALLFPVFTQAYWARIAAAFQYFSEAPNLVLSGRVASWQFLAQYLVSHPWQALVGVGYKTLPYSDFIGTTAVGDNSYLTLLAETGVAGLAALIALNVAILMTAYRAAHSTDALRSFCGAWMLCFWAGQSVQMLSADLLTYWRVLPVYFFVLALAARPNDEQPLPRSVQ